MQALRCDEILKAVNGKLISGSTKAVFRNISTDSRRIQPGDFFVPIAGERYDGHDFIKDAFEGGASGVITHRDIQPAEGKVIIRVSDTLKALGDLARAYRERFDIPFVAITGSVGKTSTKDMIACALGEQLTVLKTEGNYNNEIGLPLTIFKLESFHQAGVIEMGMSGFGEIRRLSSIVKPHIAVITNIGLSHIEKLGSRQNIMKAKLEILEGLDSNGIVILNGDDELLSGLKGLLKFRTVFYGMEEWVDYRVTGIESAGEAGTDFDVAVGGREYRIHVPVPGVHNVYNALAAFAAGLELGIPAGKLIKGIAGYVPEKMRLNIINHNGIKIINDAYNASPQSMEAALNVMKDISSGHRTIAVLGDMLEMGEWAYDAHVRVGRYAAGIGTDYIIAVGRNGAHIIEGARAVGMPDTNLSSFDNNSAAAEYIMKLVRPGDVILVKGSRGMKMEEIVSKLTGSV